MEVRTSWQNTFLQRLTSPAPPSTDSVGVAGCRRSRGERGYRDAHAVGAGMLALVLTSPGHCCRSARTCVRLPQPCRAQHGGTRGQPSGAAHRNRTHGLSVHHPNAAVRVPGTSLPLSLVPVWLFLSCPLDVPRVSPGEIPFYCAAAVQPPCTPKLRDRQHLLSALSS